MNLGGVRMADKVILTKEQAEAIEFAKKHHMRHEIIDAYMQINDSRLVDELKVLYQLSYDKFFKALYIGYEVEPEFSCEVGDWIKDTSTGAVFQVKDTQHRNNVMDSRYTTKRHATPSEIAEEKERRFWNKFGREVNEYRAGDIVKGRGVITEKWRLGPVKKTPELEGAVQIEDISDGNTIDLEMESCRLICPVEQRLDREVGK